MKYKIKLDSLKKYLTNKGWAITKIDSKASKISVNIRGEQFDIIIPNRESLPDYRIRIHYLLKSLSSIEGREYSKILEEIQNFGGAGYG